MNGIWVNYMMHKSKLLYFFSDFDLTKKGIINLLFIFKFRGFEKFIIIKIFSFTHFFKFNISIQISLHIPILYNPNIKLDNKPFFSFKFWYEKEYRLCLTFVMIVIL